VLGLRRIVIAGSVIAALAVGGLAAPPAGAALTSPPLVSASTWTNANAASGSASNALNAVSCATSSFCVAVGTQNTATGGGVLIEQWNGTAWSVATGVSIPASPNDTLDGVSCAGPSFCLAVGGQGAGALAEMWNGTSGSSVTVPVPSGINGINNLYSVSCVATNVCQALGTAFTGTTPGVYGVQWNGTTLSLTTAATPTVSAGALVEANGMSCSSPTACVAVGTNDATNTTTGTPFAEQWNGSAWSLADTGVSTGLATGSRLSSVSCVGATWCQAVGVAAGTPTTSLIETWNGTQWTGASGVPSTSASVAQALTGVDCFSTTTCSAVGFTGAGATLATLALVWNGTAWSIAANTPQGGPSATPAATSLAAVTCLTNWTCIAVGSYAITGGVDSFAMSAPIARSGYRFVAADGGIFNYGSGAAFLGSMGGQKLNAPIVGMAVMPGGDGYYLVATDGGVFNFGSAQFYGSAGSLKLNKPIVGMAVTADGGGYWLVASDGGIFSYGDAAFYGSRGGQALNSPIVSMAATPDGKGYYLVAGDGGIFNYGDGAFQGSAGSLKLNAPVVGMSVPTSGGYYLVAGDGGIFSYPPSLPFYGSTGSLKLNKPVVGMSTVAGGYYFVASDGGVFAYPPTLPFLGSMGGKPLNAPIVGMAT
jgi:hypothetical protein